MMTTFLLLLLTLSFLLTPSTQQLFTSKNHQDKNAEVLRQKYWEEDDEFSDYDDDEDEDDESINEMDDHLRVIDGDVNVVHHDSSSSPISPTQPVPTASPTQSPPTVFLTPIGPSTSKLKTPAIVAIALALLLASIGV